MSRQCPRPARCDRCRLRRSAPYPARCRSLRPPCGNRRFHGPARLTGCRHRAWRRRLRPATGGRFRPGRQGSPRYRPPRRCRAACHGPDWRPDGRRSLPRGGRPCLEGLQNRRRQSPHPQAWWRGNLGSRSSAAGRRDRRQGRARPHPWRARWSGSLRGAPHRDRRRWGWSWYRPRLQEAHPPAPCKRRSEPWRKARSGWLGRIASCRRQGWSQGPPCRR